MSDMKRIAWTYHDKQRGTDGAEQLGGVSGDWMHSSTPG